MNLISKPSYIIKLSKGNKIDFDAEIDDIGRFIYDRVYGEGFWDNRMMSSAPEDASEEEKKKREKDKAKQRTETKHIFKRKGKQFREEYLKWREEKNSPDLKNAPYRHPDFTYNTDTTPKNPSPYTESDIEDRYELSLQGINSWDPDQKDKVSSQLEINRKLKGVREPDLDINSDIYKTYKDNYVSRVGEKGYEALRFADPKKVKFGTNRYLSKSMMSHIGNIGDTSEYRKYVKYPNKKQFDKLVSWANDIYGTCFRNRADVAAFQKLVGISRVDGIIGPETEAYLQFYFGQKKDGELTFKNKSKLYRKQSNQQVYNATLKRLEQENKNNHDDGIDTNNVQFQMFDDDYYFPISSQYNSNQYGNWMRQYIYGGQGSFQEMLEMTGDPRAIKYDKQGGLIPKPNYLIKLQKGNKITFLKNGDAVFKGKYTDQVKFTRDIHNSFFNSLTSIGINRNYAKTLATYMTAQCALESQYGLKISNNYNYGGMKGSSGWKNYSSMRQYTDDVVDTFRRKYQRVFKAKTFRQYNDALFEPTYGYCPYDINRNPAKSSKDYNQKVSQDAYWVGPKKNGGISGTQKRVSDYLQIDNNWDYIEPTKSQIPSKPYEALPDNTRNNANQYKINGLIK